MRFSPCRDPAQHASLKSEIENQSTALYSTARLWDDGIIKPTDTRDVVGLGLALAARERKGGKSTVGSTTWDGDGKGYGVFRM
jgi:3-methylcrotonyl-CoA carboxylase beta subunit